MAVYSTSIRTSIPLDEAFAYMADLRNLEHWDPGVQEVTQVDGDGARPGSSFDVVVDTPGGGLTLRYHTTYFDPPRKAVVEARSRLFTSIDQIEVEVDGKSTVVTYSATHRIGNRASSALLRVLDGQPA